MATYLTNLRMPLGFPTTALPDGITPFVLTPHEVCFVGEAVAMVLATSRYIAEDGVGKVEVDYEPLPVVSDCRKALDPESPLVRPDFPNNVVNRFTVDNGYCHAALSRAAPVLEE